MCGSVPSRVGQLVEKLATGALRQPLQRPGRAQKVAAERVRAVLWRERPRRHWRGARSPPDAHSGACSCPPRRRPCEGGAPDGRLVDRWPGAPGSKQRRNQQEAASARRPDRWGSGPRAAGPAEARVSRSDRARAPRFWPPPRPWAQGADEIPAALPVSVACRLRRARESASPTRSKRRRSLTKLEN